MATKLEITKDDIANKANQKGIPPGYSWQTEQELRKQEARHLVEQAIRELPGSRYKEILLFMVNEGLI